MCASPDIKQFSFVMAKVSDRVEEIYLSSYWCLYRQTQPLSFDFRLVWIGSKKRPIAMKIKIMIELDIYCVVYKSQNPTNLFDYGKIV